MQTDNAAEQKIITIQDGEMPFFEQFVKKNGIFWGSEEKKNGILPISQSYVGYITTPNRVILLNPKYKEIGFEHIMRLYLYVYGYRPTDSAAILDVSEAESSVDVAGMFIKNLRRNVQEGILRTYERKAVKAGVIKGRVNYIKTYIALQENKNKSVFTELSSLSVKNDFNNLILTALTKLKHIGRYAPPSNELAVYFEGATDNITNASRVLENINFNSNTARYRRTLTYAAMIIDQLSYSDQGSLVGTDSFLINFDRLFEDFVVKILKDVPEKKEFSTWSDEKKFADVITDGEKNGERKYLPDILYKYIAENEEYDYMPSAYAILDVKNKAYNQFKNADVYQILTYARLLHSEKALLLYPSFRDRPPEKLELNADVFSPSYITACFVNIAVASGEDFLKSIHRFAEIVVKILNDIPL